MSWRFGCAPIKDSLESMFSWSKSSPSDVGWTEIVFSPSDVISALTPLWSSPSAFSDKEIKTFSMSFSDFLISSFIFQVILFSIVKDISPTHSSPKLFVSVSSRTELKWSEFSSLWSSPWRVFLVELLVGF